MRTSPLPLDAGQRPAGRRIHCLARTGTPLVALVLGVTWIAPPTFTAAAQTIPSSVESSWGLGAGGQSPHLTSADRPGSERATTPNLGDPTANLYVAPEATGTTCLDSATNACPTIQDAITVAETYDDTDVTIDVAAGTYDENDTITGINGGALVIQGASSAGTLIDGTQNGTVVVIKSGTVTLDHVTIQDGSWPGSGGGVAIANGGTADLSNDTISNNSAKVGGGVYDNGVVTMTHDTISNNNSSSAGAGLYIAGLGTAALSDNTISDNVTVVGGAVANFGTATLTSNTVTGNTASKTGGGLYAYTGTTMESTNDIVSNNISKFGGGVTNAGTATLTDDTISNNVLSGSTSTGAGVYNGAGGSITLAGDTIAGNQTDVAGIAGGVYNSSTATLVNDTIYANGADLEGGGVDNTGTATLSFDTISGNVAANGADLENTGTATLTANILANPGMGADCGAPVTDDGFNVDDDGSCGFTTANGDVSDSPNLNLATALAANDSVGPETLAIDNLSSAFELVPKSNCPASDERGEARPGIGSTYCDAGAYELQTLLSNAITITSTRPANAFSNAGSYTPAATDLSGTVTISIDSSSTSNCKLTSGAVTWSSAGSCVVDFASPSQLPYLGTSTSESFTIASPVTNTITITSTKPVNANSNTATYTPAATDLSGTVAISTDSSSTSNCQLASGIVVWSSAGTCVIDYASPSSPGYTGTTTSETYTITASVVSMIHATCYFATNSTKLTTNDLQTLNVFALQVAQHHITQLSVSGYADSRGSASHNVTLSTARASAVAIYLGRQVRSLGEVNVDISVQGEGVTTSSSTLALDRRVTITG